MAKHEMKVIGFEAGSFVRVCKCGEPWPCPTLARKTGKCGSCGHLGRFAGDSKHDCGLRKKIDYGRELKDAMRDTQRAIEVAEDARATLIHIMEDASHRVAALDAAIAAHTKNDRSESERLRYIFMSRGWSIHMDSREGQPSDPFVELARVLALEAK